MFGLGDKMLAIVGGGLSVVLALALAFTLLSKNAEIRHLVKERDNVAQRLDACQRDNGTLLANQGALENSVEAQNHAIQQSEAKASLKAAQHANERVEASVQAQNAARKAAALAKAVPQALECQGADQFILGSLGE
jgi:hypothetical protein